MTAIKNNYIFQLAWDLPSSGTSVKISNDLERDQAVVFTSGYVVLRSGNKIERVKGSATGWTLTLSKRGLDQSDADVEVTDLKKDWKEGTTCYVTVLAVQLQEVFDTIASWALLPPSYADDTARDAAITSPENGMIIYNEVDGLLNKYVGGTWVDDDGWAVVANASETVAGKLEEWTQGESDAGTSVWGTWAKLALTPLKAGRSVQANTWIKWADAGWDDAYVLTLTPAPATYVDWMEVLIKPTTANTGACTIDVNSLWVKNIKTLSWVDPSNGDIPTTRYTRLRYNGTDFVILDDTQSTTTNNWANKIALDATAIAGTDEVATINSKQLNYWNRIKLLSQDFVFDDSSGTLTVAHGCGKKPKLITFAYPNGDITNSINYGTWASDITTDYQKCHEVWGFWWSWWMWNGFLSYTNSSDTNDHCLWTITSVDATNINLSRSFAGAFSPVTVNTILQIHF